MEIATMHDMSNTRKEIAARLGFAAGNEKTHMSIKDGNYFVIRGFADGEIVAEKSVDTKQEAEYYGQKTLDYIKKSNPKAKKVIVEIDEVVNRDNSNSKTIKTLSSRPGAKASFGRAEDVYRLLETTPGSYANYKKRDALVTEAMRLADITPAGKDVSLHELAEMVGQDLEADRSRMSRPGTKTRMTREQTEEQKAGLKIMSAADPAVGAKIATLIKEGKPQDQAVAIALDMKRRGEL
jgi:hypothetical protein